MSIQHLRLLRYHLPLTGPLHFSNHIPLEARDGLLLELTDAHGQRAYGDIAPLPGWSKETVEDAATECLALFRRAPRGVDLEALPETLGDVAAWHRLPASVQCGVSMALQHHWANEEGTDLFQLLCPFPRRSVALAPLLTESGEALAERCALLRREEAAAVKLKVGRAAPDEDIERVRQIADLLGAGTALRLDANRAWDYDTAVRFAQAVASCNIAYIEEPLDDPRRLPEFARHGGIGYAVDESVAFALGLYFDVLEERLPPNALAGSGFAAHEIGAILENAAAVVVKPTLAGEFGRLAVMAHRMTDDTVRWIVSAAYESGVGIASLAQLAGALDADDAPAGLDTYRSLKKDVLRAPLPFGHSRLDLCQTARAARDVDTAALELVYSA